MPEKRSEDLVKELEGMEVTELDDKELDAVSGGMEAAGCTNGNCLPCAPGTADPNGCANANCPKPPEEE